MSPVGTNRSRRSAKVSFSTSWVARPSLTSSSSRLRGCTSRVMDWANVSKVTPLPWRGSTLGAPRRSRNVRDVVQCAKSSAASERCRTGGAASLASNGVTCRRVNPMAVLMRLTMRAADGSGCASRAASTKARRSKSSAVAHGTPRATASRASGRSTADSASVNARSESSFDLEVAMALRYGADHQRQPTQPPCHRHPSGAGHRKRHAWPQSVFFVVQVCATFEGVGVAAPHVSCFAGTGVTLQSASSRPGSKPRGAEGQHPVSLA
jgi:hypothetical protein